MSNANEKNGEFEQRLHKVFLDRLRRQHDFAKAHRERFETLSRRERQVLALVAGGSSNKAISETLDLSVHTVRTHRNNVWRRLEISSVVEAVWWGECFGLV